MITLAEVTEGERAAICQIAAADYSSASPDDLASVLDELLELPTLRDLAGYDGSHRAQAAAKRATSELTGRLSHAAVEATRAVAGEQPLRRYDADLVVPERIVAECALLKAVAVHFVMRRPGAAERQSAQRDLLGRLVDAVHGGAPGTLDRGMRAAWHDAADSSDSDAERLRVVIDQIAQLTDSSAVAWHERLVGNCHGVATPT